MKHHTKQATDSINFTILVSSTSDSVSRQNRLSKINKECREEDEKRFGPATLNIMDLIENFVSMYLGINLQ